MIATFMSLLVAPLIAPLIAGAATQSPPTQATPAAGPAAPPYADLADLVLASPIVADATVRSAARIKGAEAASVPADRARFYAEADVGALIRGQNGVARRVGYLVDVGADARGRVPKLKKRRVLLFARPAPAAAAGGEAAPVQLSAPDAQLDWSPAADAAVRRVVREVLSPAAPPRVTGVGNAFHVPGALPGEGETQVFLQTEGGRPVSLSVLRRPGEQPRFAVALSEIVDDAAAAPARDTLLWYRLACSLPRSLPMASTDQLSAEDRAAAERDYSFVLRSLGACGRTRGAGSAQLE